MIYKKFLLLLLLITSSVTNSAVLPKKFFDSFRSNIISEESVTFSAPEFFSKISSLKDDILPQAAANFAIRQHYKEDFDEYKVIDHLDVDGFKIVAYESSEKIILVFRGTSNRKNWLFNLSHIVGSHIYHRMTIGNCLYLSLATASASHLGWLSLITREQSKKLCIGIGLAYFTDRYTEVFTNRYASKLGSFGEAIAFKGSEAKLNAFIKNQINNKKHKPIYITGHSMGGFLAQYFASIYNLPGTSFNAPGLGAYKKQNRNEDHLDQMPFYNFRMIDDPISFIGLSAHYGSLVNLKPNADVGMRNNIYSRLFRHHSMKYFLDYLQSFYKKRV